MYRLSFLAFFLIGMLPLLGQSPHGEQLKMDCVRCHNPSGWSMDYQRFNSIMIIPTFNWKAPTNRPIVNYVIVHWSLTKHLWIVFHAIPMCIANLWEMTVCDATVLKPGWWIIFPNCMKKMAFHLIGAHSNLSCVECHTSETVYGLIGSVMIV